MQPETQMGLAMELPGTMAALNSHPKLTFRSGPFFYTIETHDGKSQYTVTDGTTTISVPIVWALGAQAQTWVLERDGKMFESMVSYYPSLKGLEFTTGDEHIDPKTLDQAFGRPMSGEEAKACFGCHATNALVDHKLNLTSLKPGLTCEHCHAGANAHLAGIVQGDMSSVPKDLGKLSSEDMANFCGQCHRSWETVVRNRWRGSSAVRFQPYRLANSKCFNGTDPRISCVACHNPHQKVVRDASFYDAKCLACHAPPLPNLPPSMPVTATSASSPHPKSCPVAKANCTTCHMPKVTLPSGHLEFSDHQIRIVKAGEPYPN
jgi:hypothetical protein